MNIGMVAIYVGFGGLFLSLFISIIWLIYPYLSGEWEHHSSNQKAIK